MTTPVLPSPSYPGTQKIFPARVDGQVVYGEHMNELQQEVAAIEGVVGLNPEEDYQGTLYLSMSDRLAHLEEDTVRLEGNQLIHGTKEFANTLQVDGFLVANRAPVMFEYADRQYVFNDTGIQGFAGNGTTPKDLLFQPGGGQLFRSSFRVWDAGNDGAGSGLDADTLDGFQAADFLVKQGCQVGMTVDQNVPPCPINGNVFTHRFPLNLNTVLWELDAGNGSMFKTDSAFGNYFDIPDSGLWVLDVNLPWSGPWQGCRQFIVKNGNYPANSMDASATTYMAYAVQVGIGPPTWPDPVTYGSGAFTSTTIFPTLTDHARMLQLTAGQKLRVDVFNWNDVGLNSVVSALGNSGVASHLHTRANVTIAQIA